MKDSDYYNSDDWNGKWKASRKYDEFKRLMDEKRKEMQKGQFHYNMMYLPYNNDLDVNFDVLDEYSFNILYNMNIKQVMENNLLSKKTYNECIGYIAKTLAFWFFMEKRCVQNEKFELAARCRDLVNILTEQSDKCMSEIFNLSYAKDGENSYAISRLCKEMILDK